MCHSLHDTMLESAFLSSRIWKDRKLRHPRYQSTCKEAPEDKEASNSHLRAAPLQNTTEYVACTETRDDNSDCDVEVHVTLYKSPHFL